MIFLPSMKNLIILQLMEHKCNVAMEPEIFKFYDDGYSSLCQLGPFSLAQSQITKHVYVTAIAIPIKILTKTFIIITSYSCNSRHFMVQKKQCCIIICYSYVYAYSWRVAYILTRQLYCHIPFFYRSTCFNSEHYKKYWEFVSYCTVGWSG